eukprot:CAMPEP_0176483220 /NCGR_PEP_ID=MMETSP0200_2-20121128/3803_1 /TAXON_ID=947934 /ORGANISM="Chaetoceros sp., Strain GSL56" /LENGTH=762 /DNA_ID=CAMNT_0017879609 /DNA_START=86 /DNA_END=2374 /DNA_ORIENTATION=-
MTTAQTNDITSCRRIRIKRKRYARTSLPTAFSLLCWGIFLVIVPCQIMMIMMPPFLHLYGSTGTIIMARMIGKGEITYYHTRKNDYGNVMENDSSPVFNTVSRTNNLLDIWDDYRDRSSGRLMSFLPAVYASSTTSMDASALRSLGRSNQDIDSFLSSSVGLEEEEEGGEEGGEEYKDDQEEQIQSLATTDWDNQNDDEYDDLYYDVYDEYNTMNDASDLEVYSVMENVDIQDYNNNDDRTEDDDDDDDDEDDNNDEEEEKEEEEVKDVILNTIDIDENNNEDSVDNYQDEVGEKLTDSEVVSRVQNDDTYLESGNTEELESFNLGDDEYYDEEYEDEEYDADVIDDAQTLHPLMGNNDDDNDKRDDDRDTENNLQKKIVTKPGKRESFKTEVMGNILSKRRTHLSVPSTVPSSSLPIMLLPKLGQTLIHSPIAVQIFAAGTLGNFALNRLGYRRKKKRMSMRKSKGDDGEGDGNSLYDSTIVGSASTTHSSANDRSNLYEVYSDDDSDVVNDDEEEEEEEGVEEEEEEENVGGVFGRPRTTRNYSNVKDFDNLEKDDTYDVTIHSREDTADLSRATNNKERTSEKNNHIFKLWKGKRSMDENSQSEENVRPKPATRKLAFFKGRKTLESEISRLTVEVDNLLKRAVDAESARDQFENDCDIAMHELREVRKEFEEVSKTNIYLKNQLVDNRKMMERAVNAERLKANNDLARVREQMVDILERERRFMRAQLSKQSAEVRSMITDSIEDDPYEYVEEEYDAE